MDYSAMMNFMQYGSPQQWQQPIVWERPIEQHRQRRNTLSGIRNTMYLLGGRKTRVPPYDAAAAPCRLLRQQQPRIMVASATANPCFARQFASTPPSAVRRNQPPQRRHTMAAGGKRVSPATGPHYSSSHAAAATARTSRQTVANVVVAAAPLEGFLRLSWSYDQLAAVLRRFYLLPIAEQFEWGFPTYDFAAGGVMVYMHDWKKEVRYNRPPNSEECIRCRADFSPAADDGTYSPAGALCSSHPCKPAQCSGPHGRTSVYSCCGRAASSLGCVQHRQHVWSGHRAGVNGPLSGFWQTVEPSAAADPTGFHDILALDAEMVYTRNGLELAKVSVCGPDGRLVYERLVLPEAPVVDYNTRFSGITEPMLRGAGVQTLAQVQQDLLRLVSARTILVGHAINNDLRYLRLLHGCVVDTSQVFAHEKGAPYRHGLRALVKQCLQMDTQLGDEGHDSFEDARNTMAVLLWHVQRYHVRQPSAQQQTRWC